MVVVSDETAAMSSTRPRVFLNIASLVSFNQRVLFVRVSFPRIHLRW